MLRVGSPSGTPLLLHPFAAVASLSALRALVYARSGAAPPSRVGLSLQWEAAPKYPGLYHCHPIFQMGTLRPSHRLCGPKAAMPLTL